MKLSFSLLSTIVMVSCLFSSVVMAQETSSPSLSWEAADKASMAMRKIAPSGDVLDSGMDALAPLTISPINIPAAGLTPDLFKDPKTAAEHLKKTLFLPDTKEEQTQLGSQDLHKIEAVRKMVIDQNASYAMTLGIKADHNVNNFAERLKRVKTLESNDNDIRDAIVIYNGITLGQLAEANKTLGLMATYAILSASDILAHSKSSDVSSGVGSDGADIIHKSQENVINTQ